MTHEDEITKAYLDAVRDNIRTAQDFANTGTGLAYTVDQMAVDMAVSLRKQGVFLVTEQSLADAMRRFGLTPEPLPGMSIESFASSILHQIGAREA